MKCDWCRDPALTRVTVGGITGTLCGNCLTEAESEFITLEKTPLDVANTTADSYERLENSTLYASTALTVQEAQHLEKAGVPSPISGDATGCKKSPFPENLAPAALGVR